MAVPAHFMGAEATNRTLVEVILSTQCRKKTKNKDGVWIYSFGLSPWYNRNGWLGVKHEVTCCFWSLRSMGGKIKVFTFCFSAWSAAWGEHPHPKPVPDHLPLRQPQREPRARGHHSDTRLPHGQHPDGRDPLPADPGAQVCHSDIGRSVLICSQPWPLDNFHKSAQHCISGECMWMRAHVLL